jgi:bifunctional non-homologous end joining protein LigD
MATQREKITVEGREITVSNLEKVLYPGAKFKKGEVINYYVRIADYLLPHLKDRPVTLKRYPDGVRGQFFYEKDAPAFTPEWVQRFSVPRRGRGGEIHYILINDLPTLVWVANTASLELHPFLHRTPQITRPTEIVFDFDPGPGTDVLTCARVAFLVRDVLQELNLESFAKVSGSKGLQVYVPLNTDVTYEVAGPFARTLAQLMEQRHPDLIVSKMSKELRPGKIFIDWSQNSDFKTTIAVYSLRAKSDRPYVSLPVTWDELQSALDRQDAQGLYFEPEQTVQRVQKVGDLFAPVETLKQSLPPDVLGFAKQSTKRTTKQTTKKKTE